MSIVFFREPLESMPIARLPVDSIEINLGTDLAVTQLIQVSILILLHRTFMHRCFYVLI